MYSYLQTLFTNITGSSAIGVASSGNVNIGRDVNIVHSSPQDELEFEMFDVPRCITSFKGREKEMEELDSLLFNKHKRKLVICALPGFGKTELSKQYAHRCVASKRVHRAFWIKAEDINGLQISFKILKKIYKTFSGKVTMFVFDNVTCRSDIYEYEPPSDNGNFIFLITSREKNNWGSDMNPVPIGPLSPEATVDIYKSFLNGNYREEDRSLYVELADVVGYIPLGLQITGAYIQQQMNALENGFVLSEYIEALKSSQKDIVDATIPSYSPNTYENSIYVAVSASLNKIQDMKGPHAPELVLKILCICSYLDPDEIGFEDLIEICKSNEILKTSKSSINDIKEALNLLSNYLFVTYNSGGLCIKMHRLIQDVVRLYLQSNTEVQSSCYTACLQYIFEIQKNFYYTSHCRYVMKYADDNISLIYIFYKKYSIKGSEVLNKILLSLIVWECYDSLKNIIENDGKWTMKDIIKIITCRKGNISNETILSLLLTYDLDINKSDANQLTPLLIAVNFWNLKAIKTLIKCKANIDAKDFDEITALDCFLRNAFLHENVNMVEVNNILKLLQLEIKTNDMENIIPFVVAGCSQNTERLNQLVQRGFDINSTTVNQITPTHVAAYLYNINALKFLINLNADINIRDSFGRTALFSFIEGLRNRENINMDEVKDILDLLQCKQNKDITDNNNNTLLYFAAQSCHEDLVSLLITEYEFNVNHRDLQGDTPLHDVVISFDKDTPRSQQAVIRTVEVLKGHGADLNILNKDGKTPLQLAKEKGAEFLIPFLTESSFRY